MMISRLSKNLVTRPKSQRVLKLEYHSLYKNWSIISSVTMSYRRPWISSMMMYWKRRSCIQSSHYSHHWCSWNTARKFSRSSRSYIQIFSILLLVTTTEAQTLINGLSTQTIQAYLRIRPVILATPWSISIRKSKVNSNLLELKTSSQPSNLSRTGSIPSHSSQIILSKINRTISITRLKIKELHSILMYQSTSTITTQLKTNWSSNLSHLSLLNHQVLSTRKDKATIKILCLSRSTFRMVIHPVSTLDTDCFEIEFYVIKSKKTSYVKFNCRYSSVSVKYDVVN